MTKVAIFYGSSTGATQAVAEIIASKLNGYSTDLIDVANAKIDDIDKYNNIIFGTSTWGVGDLQDDWELFLPKVEKVNLNGKVIALFGIGDSEGFASSFVDGMGTIYESIKNKGCKIVGLTNANGYSFSESKAFVGGNFVGLPIDDTNEPDLTETRIDKWIKDISQFFI